MSEKARKILMKLFYMAHKNAKTESEMNHIEKLMVQLDAELMGGRK